LEAAVTVHIDTAGAMEAFEDLDPAEVFRVSQARLEPGPGSADAYRSEGVTGVAVVVAKAPGRKCARSWRVLPEVGSDPRYPDLSLRDAEAVAWWDARHL
jgi:isoleucyl-tRNA synthetase